MALLGLRFSGGRAETAPKLRNKTEAGQDNEILAMDMVHNIGEDEHVTQDGYEYLAEIIEGVRVPEAYQHDPIQPLTLPTATSSGCSREPSQAPK